ncbi:MAG: spore germination protein [Clostridiales bacterium]|nr:spore germination protein [Clostridiales bacterium]
MFTEIDSNIKIFEDMFKDCGDLVKRKIPVSDTFIYLLYLDGMNDRDMIESRVLETLMIEIRKVSPERPENPVEALINGGITTADFSEEAHFEKAPEKIMSGETLLLIDGYSKAIIISSKHFPKRGIDKPDTEGSINGPKEAFCENFRDNTALIRRRIRDTKLKIKQLQTGRRSRTDIGLVYMEDIVRPEILKETEERIKNIDIDAVSSSSALAQLMSKNELSPFPSFQLTERPDKAAAEILEGRIVIVVDTSPFVIILPAVLACFYQASEDYYENWQTASLVRVIRYLASFIALSLPGLYICFALYNPSMLPAALLMKMSSARNGVPISGILEIFLMELAFEALREAGARMPEAIGQTLGIVGGIIVGQAAVDAGLVSPIVVIVVSLTGICSFAIPQLALSSAYRLSKYFIMISSSFFGLLGFCSAFAVILIHLASRESFGIPYLYPFGGGDIEGDEGIRDTFFRLPVRAYKKRPIFSNNNQKIRLREKN